MSLYEPCGSSRSHSRRGGAVITLLLWFYLTGVTILIGGEVNAIIEQAASSHQDPEAKRQGKAFR